MSQMTPEAFIAKWKPVTVSERSSAQQHFLDLCDLLNHPKPAEADPAGSHFTFEKGVTTTDGKKGWADVWKKGHFAWEYKRKSKHATLANAYQQLLQYREDLENPPVLVVCDIGRIEVHTNFTGTAKRVHEFTLSEFAEPRVLETLRWVFHAPDKLKPNLTRKTVTEEVARRLGGLADRLVERGIPLRDTAKFIMKLIFCMFSEDVDLLSGRVFTRMVENFGRQPRALARQMRRLFRSMDTGGAFGADRIPYFNGGLFKDHSAIELTADEIADLVRVNECDWGDVEPSIFGTLLERTLDPAKRDQVGTHYTSKDDILAVLEPVLMTPLRREWRDVRADCDALWQQIQENMRAAGPGARRRKPSREREGFDRKLMDFAHRLTQVKILDPACGSGNFLYVAMNLLLDLEKEVVAYGQARGCPPLSFARPGQLLGIEKYPFAQELAQVVVWIGFLQWKWQNGFSPKSKPVLDPGEGIHLMDAILDLSDPQNPREPEWPECDYIVGNPPFLGGKKLRSGLGDEYVDALFKTWRGRVPAESDLCCYWFEKARAQVEAKRCLRAGLLATQGIRGGKNREVLGRIKTTGDIFFGMSDRDWILDGASVHVSMVGFDAGEEKVRTLDGASVSQIHSDLTSGVDVTKAKSIPSRLGLAFMGDTKGGDFDIPERLALEMLDSPNPNGRPNSDVVVPWVNGRDVTGRNRRKWIIDFGIDRAESEAALYEAPFEYARQHIRPKRQKNRREGYSERWWIHVEARPGMRNALNALSRFLVIIRVAKHQSFVWQVAPTLPDCQLITFACEDDYHLGLLHSRVHWIWARSKGTQVRDRQSGFRYTPTSCFETFPLPASPGGLQIEIAEAAQRLDSLREGWLNPAEWVREEVLTFRGSTTGPWARYVHGADDKGVGTVRFPRAVPKDPDCARKLAKQTMTALYNKRPTWLAEAHREIDEAVLAAYGLTPAATDDAIRARLMELNREASSHKLKPVAVEKPVATSRR